MKQRQLGREPKRALGPEKTRSGKDGREEAPEPDDELEDGIAPEPLFDQGDGVRVARGRRRPGASEERTIYECPDRPPPGFFGDES